MLSGFDLLSITRTRLHRIEECKGKVAYLSEVVGNPEQPILCLVYLVSDLPADEHRDLIGKPTFPYHSDGTPGPVAYGDFNQPFYVRPGWIEIHVNVEVPKPENTPFGQQWFWNGTNWQLVRLLEATPIPMIRPITLLGPMLDPVTRLPMPLDHRKPAHPRKKRLTREEKAAAHVAALEAEVVRLENLCEQLRHPSWAKEGSKEEQLEKVAEIERQALEEPTPGS
jgi:hypothetical protein